MKSLLRTLNELFDVLPSGAKSFYLGYAIFTGLLAVLDVAALGLIILVVSPLATGSPIVLPVFGEVPLAAAPWVVIVVCALFISKGLIAVLLHWFATRRFARYELEVGDSLFRGYTHASWEQRSQMSTAEVTRLVDVSMANTNLGFILPISQIPGSALTFVAVLAVLVIAKPVVALVALAYLLSFSVAMVLIVSRRAKLAGSHNRIYGYRVATIMTEMVDALKEVVLRGKLDEIGRVVTANRRKSTRARANMAFLSIVPRYAFEAVLIGGFLLVGGVAYFIGGAAEALVAVSLFAATGFRMIPAMNGVQGSIAQASANEIYARDVIREMRNAAATIAAVKPMVVAPDAHTTVLPERPIALNLREVAFRYGEEHEEVLRDLALTIPFGKSLAIVGPSGAGKSTLIDILLGLSVPTEGAIDIDGIPLESVLGAWRDRVGYVPQRVALFDASIGQNVALTWENDFDEERVELALRRAHLSDLLDRPGGMHALIGERGASISGGQQQRLGIARALYSNPLVMVMDEATSALDTSTEHSVSASMRELRGDVTFITVAHRLATIRDYDQICYLDRGRILDEEHSRK